MGVKDVDWYDNITEFTHTPEGMYVTLKDGTVHRFRLTEMGAEWVSRAKPIDPNQQELFGRGNTRDG